MKAAVFKNSGLPLSIEEIEDPVPSPTDMVIKVCACGIYGTDLHWAEINNEESGFRDIYPGAVMGHEFSGEIVEIGKHDDLLWKGGLYAHLWNEQKGGINKSSSNELLSSIAGLS